MAGLPALSRWATTLWRTLAVTSTSPVTAGGSVGAAPARRISIRWGPAGTWIGSVTRSDSNERELYQRVHLHPYADLRRIDARRFPKIRGETTELNENGGAYRVRGDLTFHGVTRPVEGEVTISAPDERSLLIEGEQVFDIREFGVEPPKILMFRVHPDVKVRIKVVAQQEG